MPREIIGAKEIIGQDDGAQGNAPGGMSRVIDVPDKRQRDYPLGFSATDTGGGVAAGATVDIKQTPQLLFRGERLVISDKPAMLSNPAGVGTIADNFNLVNIIAGQQIQQVASGELDGTAFKPLAFGTRMLLQTVVNGWEFVLRVHNTDAVNDLDFASVLFGRCFAP